MTRTATRNAPEAGQGFEGNDQNTYKGEPIAMKTTAPRVAHAPDNEELASSRDSALVPCVDESCAYFHQGHYADASEPLFVHRFVSVREEGFRVSVERFSTDDNWDLSINVLDEDLTPQRARLLARALVRCSDITESLNAERHHNAEVAC
ncbi:hypothetical protein [Curtobacterium aetherium]|uniref:Uncharacterized protein n=1 Tax=Curtobacterium aetherium TaxID=2841594 RepID=A0ACD1E5C4_9MICO|nr:hypothetical protein [Curtobacterium sp. L6-1]QWS34041.1 hypothetical protein KM842_02225 [Curtobacterium sp. L6-1]